MSESYTEKILFFCQDIFSIVITTLVGISSYIVLS